MLDSYFIYGDLPLNVETGVYQLPLVILSYMVASFASYTALSLAQNVVNANNAVEKRLFHWGGSFAMGAGIWSMHFIGMLSYKMDMVVEYDPAMTVFSMLIAIAFSYGVLNIIATHTKLGAWQILGSAILLGVGICAMHYTGMAAMQMDGDLRYSPLLYFCSLLIAIAASGAALMMAFMLARHGGQYRYLFQIGAALIMGTAICGMHYTGMAAAVFIPWADCRYDPYQNFTGMALAIAGITTLILFLALAAGIYKKNQIEFQLQNSENRLRTMIDGALDAVIGMDQKGLITVWNKQAEETYGWPAKEVIGQPLAETIIPPELRDAHNQGMQRFIAQGIGPILNNRIEVTAMNKNSQRFPVELTVTAQKLHDKKYHFTAFSRDTTAQKKAEEVRALLAAIVESSDDAIISKTPEGIITSWNAGAERLYDYTADEAVGRHISIIIPEDRQGEEHKIMAKLKKGKRIEHYETVRRAKNGGKIDVSMTISPLRDKKGNIIGLSNVARNITDRKAAEASLLEYTEKLKRSNQELDDFAYIASHDLKEPLRGLHNFSRFLLEDYEGKLDGDGKNMLNTIADLTKRMDALLSSLLHYSRLGQTELSVQKTDLNQIVQDAIAMYGVQIDGSGTDVRVTKKLPEIICDHVRIAEVFQNLIGNALKYNDKPDKKIEIGYFKDYPGHKGQIVYFVRDNGIGIDEKNLDNIFKIFRRLHAQDAYGGGTGSGLTIAKRIITRHGGQIWAESSGKGQGTTFCFTIPA